MSAEISVCAPLGLWEDLKSIDCENKTRDEAHVSEQLLWHEFHRKGLTKSSLSQSLSTGLACSWPELEPLSINSKEELQHTLNFFFLINCFGFYLITFTGSSFLAQKLVQDYVDFFIFHSEDFIQNNLQMSFSLYSF